MRNSLVIAAETLRNDFLAQIRPEFPEQVGFHVADQSIAGVYQGVIESAISLWIVTIGDGFGDEPAQHMRGVEAAAAIIVAGDHNAAHGIEGAAGHAALAHAEVARILPQHHRQKKFAEEHGRFTIRQRRAVARAVTFHSAAKAAVLATGLRNAGIEGGAREGEWGKRMAREDLEFLARG